MHIREELQITKPLEPGHEVALALLLTREYVARLFDACLYEPEGLSDQQFNVLRILKGGPKDGYLVKELRCHFSEKKAMALLYKLEQCTKELAAITRQVVELSREFQERWSQKSR